LHDNPDIALLINKEKDDPEGSPGEQLKCDIVSLSELVTEGGALLSLKSIGGSQGKFSVRFIDLSLKLHFFTPERFEQLPQCSPLVAPQLKTVCFEELDHLPVSVFNPTKQSKEFVCFHSAL
jgi:hypothetical protein